MENYEFKSRCGPWSFSHPEQPPTGNKVFDPPTSSGEAQSSPDQCHGSRVQRCRAWCGILKPLTVLSCHAKYKILGPWLSQSFQPVSWAQKSKGVSSGAGVVPGPSARQSSTLYPATFLLFCLPTHTNSVRWAPELPSGYWKSCYLGARSHAHIGNWGQLAHVTRACCLDSWKLGTFRACFSSSINCRRLGGVNRHSDSWLIVFVCVLKYNTLSRGPWEGCHHPL